MTDTIHVKPEEQSDEIGYNDPIIKDFIKAHDLYKTNTERLNKLEDIEDDYEELEYYSRPTNVRNEVKPGAIFKILRVYDTEAKQLPKVKPFDEQASLTTLSIVDSAKTQIWQDGGVQDVWDDVRQRFKSEGTAIVQMGYDSGGEYIPMECSELAEMYFDASKNNIASDSSRTGKTIKTIIREVKTDYGTLKGMYPDLWDKVTPGSPSASNESREVYNRTTESEQDESADVYIHYAYSIEDGKNPTFCVYAGGNALKLELHQGKEYPFWRKQGKKKVAFLPFIEFHATDTRRGFYSPSVIGLAKDKTRPMASALFTSMPIFAKRVNPILLMLGSNQDVSEQMSLATELQEMGESHIIQTQDQAQIQTVSPQSIFAEVEEMRVMLYRELSAAFGFNVQELEEVEQSATEFVGKTKAELKAIGGLYKINTKGFSKLAEYAIALAAENWKTSDEREINFTDDAGVEGNLAFNIALMELKEWTGTFIVETDLKMPMSTQDKAQAINEINALLINQAYSIPFKSMDEVELRIATIEAMAGMRDLDNIFTKPKISRVFELVLEGQEQAIVDAQAPQVEGEPDQTVEQELAPQAALAEAGLTP